MTGDRPILLKALIGDVLVLTLNRPEKRNALNRPLFRELEQTLSTLERTGARAVVITGAEDRAFSAGADINELATCDRKATDELIRRGQRIFDSLEVLSQPTVAAINGAALGGGLELAMACDIRIAADHATFGMPEITLANVPGWGGTQRLPQLVGVGRATHAILTGDRLTASDAQHWGLVSAVVPHDSLMAAAVELAGRVAGHAPLALQCAKRAIRTGRWHGMSAGLEAEREAVLACTGTTEQRGATVAYLPDRYPISTVPEEEQRDDSSDR